jgi:hypothetical protein
MLSCVEMFPPADAVLEGLARIAREMMPVAIAWHVALAVVLLALGFGYRPSRRSAGVVLALPLASASLVAWLYANPFNAVVLGIGALALGSAAWKLPTSRAQAGTKAARLVALSLLGFGWFYPHFRAPGAGLAVLYSAPLGTLPCPTLAMVVGLAYFAQGFESRLWSSILGGLGVFYGLIGTLWLGVTSDMFLAFGGLLLLGRAWSRHLPSVLQNASP